MLLRVAITVLLLLVGCGRAAAVSTLELDGAGREPLNGLLMYREDAAQTLTIDQIQAPDLEWQPSRSEIFNQGYSDSAWWLHLRIANPLPQTEQRLIELSYAVLDQVDVFVLDGGRTLQVHALGDKLPFSQRLLQHRFFLIPLEWQPGQTLDIYLRLRTGSAVQAPLTLWQRDAFADFDSTRTLLHGLFFGTMLAIAVYNLLVYLILRDRNYLLYVGYVVCMPIFLGSLDGHAFRYLWPNLTQWNDNAILVFLSGVVFFSSAFTRRFLTLEVDQPILNNILKATAIASILMVVMTFLLPYHFNIRILIPLASLTCVVAFFAGIYGWYHHRITARYYTIAWGFMLSGGLILALNKFHLIPATVFTEYATHIGSALEVVMLSFALAERINAERRLRFAAQQQALDTTQRMNAELEGRVQARTQELENLMQRLRDLSNTDPLTGLRNRRFLDDLLREEWERGLRYRNSLAIVLLDIDHFKQVNDEYGHQVGDECLLEAALRVQQGLRWPADQAARFGGEEFCVVLPETDTTGAESVAERIRQLIEEQPFATSVGQLTITASAGVCALVPDSENTVSLLLKNADLALYQAKRSGRNCVRVFTSTHNVY